MTEPLILYGMPVSMFTGKVRSYLRKRGIPFRERLVADPRFADRILPGLDRFIFPAIETADGVIVQDSSDILAHLEGGMDDGRSIHPSGPRQAILSRILELFGDEGMLRAAMHYRWNFPDTNRAFLTTAFAAGIAPQAPRHDAEAIAGQSMAKMAGYLSSLGVTDGTVPSVERGYETLLSALDDHFRDLPYLLGGAPCLGDFGLMAAFYAHLARDPYPAGRMKTEAHFVWRWVERMNAPESDMPEFGDLEPAHLGDDTVPETLKAVLRQIAVQYLPELIAQVAALDLWLGEHPDIAAGQRLQSEDRARRPRGMVQFEVEGTPFTVGLRPTAVLRLQRITDAFDALSEADQAVVRAFLADVGLLSLLDLRARRRIERRANRDVWGDAEPG